MSGFWSWFLPFEVYLEQGGLQWPEKTFISNLPYAKSQFDKSDLNAKKLLKEIGPLYQYQGDV